MGGRGRCGARLFLLFIFVPVQQTTSEIGHHVKQLFRIGNQYAECEKQQHKIQRTNIQAEGISVLSVS